MYKPKSTGRSSGRRSDNRFDHRTDHRSERDQDSRRSSERRAPRGRPAKFNLPKGTTVDYKEVNLLQRYITERGKILSRRVTGISAKEQRDMVRAIKKARFLGLLTVLGAKRK